jgi:chitin disaccharide deacetylase
LSTPAFQSTRLIVNADDFGLSAGVNRGVAVAHEDGIVTSASLMVRRLGAEEAAAYALRNPKLGVGLHVDLGEWLYRKGGWEAVEVVAGPAEVEIHRQLARFRELLGRDPTHLDSHQHVHREQAVGSRLADLAEELGIPLRGRNDRVRYCGDFYGQTGTGQALPDAIGVEALLDLLATLPPGVTELGCHPGVGTDDDLPYGTERSVEVQALCDPRVRAALAANEIELCSFADIG